jgi:CheY-like chemotaxis protein
MERRPSIFETKSCDILIVDDSGLNRRMLKRILHVSGYDFDEAEDGLIALDKVKARMSTAVEGPNKDHYDVILMDFVMPNMDGPTATKAIRALGYTAPIFGKSILLFIRILVNIFISISSCSKCMSGLI